MPIVQLRLIVGVQLYSYGYNVCYTMCSMRQRQSTGYGDGGTWKFVSACVVNSRRVLFDDVS